MDPGMTRREFLGGAVALGALGITGCATTPSGAGGRLPAQREFLIRNAYVMTM